MKINYRKSKKKDCLAQNRYIYEFDKKIDKAFITFLEKYGKVTVYHDFAIPLVTMDEPKKFRLQTLMDSNKLDVFFKSPKLFITKFEKELNNFLEKK